MRLANSLQMLKINSNTKRKEPSKLSIRTFISKHSQLVDDRIGGEAAIRQLHAEYCLQPIPDIRALRSERLLQAPMLTKH
jgi:hypothetical protein